MKLGKGVREMASYHSQSNHARRFLRRMAIYLVMAACFSVAIFVISRNIIGSFVIGGVFLLYLLRNVYFDYIDTKREERDRSPKR